MVVDVGSAQREKRRTAAAQQQLGKDEEQYRPCGGGRSLDAVVAPEVIVGRGQAGRQPLESYHFLFLHRYYPAHVFLGVIHDGNANVFLGDEVGYHKNERADPHYNGTNPW